MPNKIGTSLNRGINAAQTAGEFFAGSNNFVAYAIRPTNERGLGLSGFVASVVLDAADIDPAGNNRASVYLFEKFLVTPGAGGGDFLSVDFIAQFALFSYEEFFTGRFSLLKDIFWPAFPLYPNEDYSLVLRFEGGVIAGTPQLRLTPYGYSKENDIPSPLRFR